MSVQILLLHAYLRLPTSEFESPQGVTELKTGNAKIKLDTRILCPLYTIFPVIADTSKAYQMHQQKTSQKGVVALAETADFRIHLHSFFNAFASY